MDQDDDWAIRLERLRPPPSPPRNERGGRHRTRGSRQPARSAGARRLVPVLLLVVGGVWLSSSGLPLDTAPPDPVTLARQSRDLGWTMPADHLDLAMDVFARVNEERVARGLAALSWHPGLAALAENWSLTMIQDVYEHSPEGYLAHPQFAGAGENIAMGQRTTDEVHVDWMESDGHRANILRPEFSAMGVGIVCRADGRMWATQVFGLPHGVPADFDAATPPTEPVVRRDAGIACPRTARTSWFPLPLG